MFGGTLNGILSVSPALKITDVVVTVQLLTTSEGADVEEPPQDNVAATMGQTRYRVVVSLAPPESLVTAMG